MEVAFNRLAITITIYFHTFHNNGACHSVLQHIVRLYELFYHDIHKYICYNVFSVAIVLYLLAD